MNRLSEVIPDGPDVVMISDRHKSIMKAVRQVYKQADHGFCARHISQNLKSHVNRGAGRKGSRGETVAKLFFKCASEYREKEFKELYSNFKNMYPKAAEYVQKEELAPEKWARCKFRTERYNLLTTNGAESINSVLKKAKRYPLLSLLDICVSKTAEWFSRYRVEACGADDSQKLTPYVYKVLHERFEKACTYEVNLSDRTCSCRKFDVDRYPCSHAIAAAHKVGKGTEIHELCSEYYWRETWVKAYQETVYPVPDICDWVVPPEILNFSVMPPIIEEKRRTGRPKQNRFPGPGEARKRPHNSTSSFSQSDSSKRTNLKLFA
ncbi:PREDICTED: uncharacterized protein LOC109116550 [Tarenaya hassleriana]|uniref:uncharacterized protein LOC109116550 n=1 Tax=Tarenaya hassleriana TaxID=28532 RepID=UPI0008FCEDEB|nr:PREDICTED: uncharacterized protein LOC109116550 [Tarenaya hassleriana]